MPQTERRTRRSENRQEALGLLLEAARTRSGARALSLTDRDGLFIAGAGDSRFGLEELGALGSGGFAWWNKSNVEVAEVPVGHATLALSCAGDRAADSRVLEGIQRILG